MRLYCEQYDYYLYIICKEMVYNTSLPCTPSKASSLRSAAEKRHLLVPFSRTATKRLQELFLWSFCYFLLSCCRNLESAVETVMVVKRSLRLLSDLNWLWMAETQALLLHSQQRPGITKMWNLDGLSSLMKKANKRSRFSAEC